LTPLPRSFYEPSAALVAPRLLGHWLIRTLPEGPCGGPIVETEAYLVDDPASHGFGGERARNKAIYGPPGYSYVYLIYGFHWCFNAVCCRPGVAEAVLIRAIEPRIGVEIMRKNRRTAMETSLTNGPGKLCQALAIDRQHYGLDLCDPSSPVFIAKSPNRPRFPRKSGPVAISTRIGITKAAALPLRFYLPGSPFISRPARAAAASSTG